MFDCAHERQELRQVMQSNNVVVHAYQCIDCGEKLNPVKKNPWLEDVPWLDEGLRDRKRAEAERQRAEKLNAAQAVRRSHYTQYIESPEWRRKADTRLRMDGNVCQARMAGCLGHATQVHHLTYDHFGEEPMFDLVSVCGRCHLQITERDRANRGKAA